MHNNYNDDIMKHLLESETGKGVYFENTVNLY